MSKSHNLAVSASTTDLDSSYSIDLFCALENLSRATYFRLRRQGLGPDEIRIPGTRIVRITPRARTEWHGRLAKFSAENSAKVERKRRADLARHAGQIAAKSPRHVSKRGTARS